MLTNKNRIDVKDQVDFCYLLAKRLRKEISDSLSRTNDEFNRIEKSTVHKNDIIRLRRELLKLSKMITYNPYED